MVDYDPRWGQAIASIESRGSKDPYTLLGPRTRTGDQAHGKYQVMGANIPEWSQAALGRRMTPQEFLADQEAQETIFKHRFGGYAQKYGNPQDAASAWFTGQPRSASVGQRKDILGTSGNSYVSQFDNYLGGSAGATAIQSAMRPSATGPSMASLYPSQPGALAPAEPQGYDWSGALQGAGAGLASISSPAQGAALAQIASQSRKQKANTGTWSMGAVDPTTGIASMINSLTGETRTQQIHAPKPEKDKAAEAYRASEAKSYAEQNQKIGADALASQTALGNLGTLETALANPAVYQGSGGETVAYLKKVGNSSFGMTFDGIADADVATALMNKMTQESRLLNGGMPGSLSNSDLEFLKKANPSLSNNPDANKRIIQIYGKLHQRNIELNDDRLEYTKNGQMLDEGFMRSQTEKLKGRFTAENEAFKAEAAKPATPATSAPFKTPNGVTWSIN